MKAGQSSSRTLAQILHVFLCVNNGTIEKSGETHLVNSGNSQCVYFFFIVLFFGGGAIQRPQTSNRKKINAYWMSAAASPPPPILVPLAVNSSAISSKSYEASCFVFVQGFTKWEGVGMENLNLLMPLLELD